MGQFTPRTRDYILERMINRTVARSDLNDLNDGSSIKQVLAAAAREDDDQYFQMSNLLDLFDILKARGTDLDERAKEYNPALITRIQAEYATGEVVFSRTGTTGTVTIAIGTQVKVPASGGQAERVFTTTEVGTISAGNQSSNNVDVVANVAGADGNADVSTVTGFVNKPSGVDSVTNPAAFTSGRDVETDDSFRQRLLAQVKGLARSHVYGLEQAALTAEDSATGKRAVFAKVVEDSDNPGNVIVYVDDGAGTAESTQSVTTDGLGLAGGIALGGEVDLYATHRPLKTTVPVVITHDPLGGGSPVVLVEGTDYTLDPAKGHVKLTEASFPTGLTATDVVNGAYDYYDGLIQECQKIIDGDPTDRANYPGFRAGGVLVRVLPPSIVQQVLSANITVKRGYSQTDVATLVEAAISGYINSLGISEDVVLNEIRERSMAVAGMYDIAVVTPTENTVILDHQIARIIASNITIN